MQAAARSWGNPLGHEAEQHRKAGCILHPNPRTGLKSPVTSVILLLQNHSNQQKQCWTWTSLKDNFSNANHSWATENHSLGFLLGQILHSQHQVQPELLDVLEKQEIFLAIPGFHQHAQPCGAWGVRMPSTYLLV